MSQFTETKWYETFVRRAGIKADHADLLNLLRIESGVKVLRANPDALKNKICTNMQKAITKLKTHPRITPEIFLILDLYDGTLGLHLSAISLAEIGSILSKSTDSLK